MHLLMQMPLSLYDMHNALSYMELFTLSKILVLIAKLEISFDFRAL